MRPMKTCCGFNPIQTHTKTQESSEHRWRDPAGQCPLSQVPSLRYIGWSQSSRWIYRLWGQGLELHWPPQSPTCVRNSLPWQPQPPKGDNHDVNVYFQLLHLLHYYLLCFQKPGGSRVGKEEYFQLFQIFSINHFWAPIQPVSGI